MIIRVITVAVFANHRRLEAMVFVFKGDFSMKYCFFLVIAILCSNLLHARVLVPGTPTDAITTLPVAISNFVPVLNDLADGVFITAGQPGAKDFALAGYLSALRAFVPYAPESVTLNGAKSANPLYDASIDLVTFMNNQPSTFFAVPDKNNPILYFRLLRDTLVSTDALRDANGNPASSVVAMVGSSSANGAAYLAVTPQGSPNFGDPGSGILAAAGTTSTIQLLPTAPLNATSLAFTLGTTPVTMTGGASLAWLIPLEILYVGASSVTSGPAITDRLSLVARNVGPIVHPTFNFASLVPGTNYGLLAVGASVTGIIAHMQTMETSTRQPLLVTCGRILDGGELPNDVKNQVYAFPLNRMFDSNSKIEKLLHVNSGFLAKKGSLSDFALDASELYTIADAPVRVGQGPLPTGVVINQLLTNGDCVYAVVNALFPGVYVSRALFDAQGLVVAWTPWTRIINTPDDIFAAALNTITGTWFMLSTDNLVANTVLRTTWQPEPGKELTGVAGALTRLTTPEPQSITALSSYDYRTPGMGDVAAFVCTERNQIILAQTGFTITSNPDPILYQTLPDFAYGAPITTDEHTVLTTPVGSNPLVLIKGTVLDELAPLTTATIVHSVTQQQTWLVVGGEGGVAIWATQAGAGWGNEFGADLSALPLGLVMQKLGDYKDVRTVYADSPYLYVATPEKVDRFDLCEGITVTPVTVAEVGKNLQQDIITDILFCRELGFISTNIGLYRIKSGSSALSAEPEWALQDLPECEFPIKTITGYGLNGLPTTISQGGNCWILSGTARNNRSILNRLAVSPFGGSVAENTVEPFTCDFFIGKKPSFFLDFGEYKDIVTSDGAEYLFARSVQYKAEANIRTPNVRNFGGNGLYYFEQPRSTNRFVGVKSLLLFPSPVAGNALLQSNSDINVLLQELATGAWYIATNNGLIVQG